MKICRYRAEIVAIQVNETLPHELLFDVYFLDYGDSQFISKKDILELRADFLSLRFQAIECFLAHVQPSNNGSKLDEWDEKAVEKFEELVQVAHWKKLISKVVTYKERKSFAFQRQSTQRESSPIPGVELYDPEDNAGANIALVLVKLGYAEVSNRFGDLAKSAILHPSDNQAHKGDLLEKEKSPASDIQTPKDDLLKKEKSPAIDIPTHTGAVLEKAKSPEPVKPEPANDKNEKKSEESEPRTNGEAPKSPPATQESPDLFTFDEPAPAPKATPPTQEPSNLFTTVKPAPVNSQKNQVSDFLRSEQKATSKGNKASSKGVKSKSKKHAQSGGDWNALMDE